MNLQLLAGFIEKHRQMPLVVDTNLLLLYFAGCLRPEIIRKFNRTSGYSEDDFNLLVQVVGRFKRITTTPHILTEVSNLLGQRGEPDRSDLRILLGRAIENWDEHYTPARELSNATCFVRLGMTDAAIACMQPGSCLVLTDDGPLAGHLKKCRTPVLQFQQLRAACL